VTDAAYNAAYYAANKERELAMGKAWKTANRSTQNEREKKYRLANIERVRRNHRRQGWKGIIGYNGDQFDETDYDRAFLIQGGRCLICRRHQSELKKRLAVDHNHKTGMFRALLCSVCNFRVGAYETFRLQGEIYLSGGR
jgi:hypothetical protein